MSNFLQKILPCQKKKKDEVKHVRNFDITTFPDGGTQFNAKYHGWRRWGDGQKFSLPSDVESKKINDDMIEALEEYMAKRPFLYQREYIDKRRTKDRESIEALRKSSAKDGSSESLKRYSTGVYREYSALLLQAQKSNEIMDREAKEEEEEAVEKEEEPCEECVTWEEDETKEAYDEAEAMEEEEIYEEEEMYEEEEVLEEDMIEPENQDDDKGEQKEENGDGKDEEPKNEGEALVKKRGFSFRKGSTPNRNDLTEEILKKDEKPNKEDETSGKKRGASKRKTSSPKRNEDISKDDQKKEGVAADKKKKASKTKGSTPKHGEAKEEEAKEDGEHKNESKRKGSTGNRLNKWLKK